ncbi:hypothetical protein V5799_009101 [Amblyomma americanum]|uniref:Cyclic nucleotide phosphodiesterase catalytic domain-containing protein n=1 Tax=Amblyomma americanum TaxID=6943 RepID=A0AAQ4FBA3_AMBAM
MVWEVSNFLTLASRHGYTVIIVDAPQQLTSNPEVLSVASNKGQGRPNTATLDKQWEDVHPFATGWSPRPKDAARLLRRFRQLRTALHMEDRTLTPRDVSSSQVFPFCLARLCRFGRAPEDKDYCNSEKVKEAYGRSDTLRVFGYAVVRGYVFALVELSEEQASLTRGDGGATDTSDVDALSRHFEVGLSPKSWDEVSCIVDLVKFLPEEDGNDQDNALRRVTRRISLRDVVPSRVTFMPLGSVEGTKYSYSEAAAAPWTLLSSRLRSWAAQSAEGVDCAETVGGIDVYGYAKPTVGVLLLVDSATVELDVVFTGYYHPHTTELSGRCSVWPRGGPCSPPERLPRRQENQGGPPEGALSWRKAQQEHSRELSKERSQERQLFWRPNPRGGH